jgi:hypothetical protein
VIPAVAELDASGTSGEEQQDRRRAAQDPRPAELRGRGDDGACAGRALPFGGGAPAHAPTGRAGRAGQALRERRHRLRDDPHGPRPRECAGTDPVHVGRIRAGSRGKRSLCFFAVGDQLRKGAALNALQVAGALPER